MSEHAGDAGLGVVGAEYLAQVQVAEDVQPVVDGDGDRVALPGQRAAVVHGGAAGAVGEAAAVQPDHHRPRLAVEAGRPDVEEQAVLRGGRLVRRRRIAGRGARSPGARPDWMAGAP
jgi:hypothetical protein